MIADNRRHLTPKDSRFSIWAVLYLSAEIHRQCKQQGEGNERAGKGGREKSKRPPEKDKKAQEREEESRGHFVGMETVLPIFLLLQ